MSDENWMKSDEWWKKKKKKKAPKDSNYTTDTWL